MRTGRTRAIAPALALVLPALTGKPQGMPNRCPVDHRQHTKANVVVPIVRIVVPVAVVGAGVVLIVDPRPAAQNPGGRSRGTRLASQRHHYSKYIQKNRGRNTFCLKEFVGKGLPAYNKKIDRRWRGGAADSQSADSVNGDHRQHTKANEVAPKARKVVPVAVDGAGVV